MVLHRFVAAILVATASAGCGAAEIYKYTAPDGSIAFTDKRPEQPAQIVSVDAPKDVSAQQRERDAAQLRALEGQAKRRLEKDGEQRAARKTVDDARCRKAREESAYFQHDAVTRRLEKDDPRPFYTAAEILQRRNAARRDMAEFCPPT